MDWAEEVVGEVNKIVVAGLGPLLSVDEINAIVKEIFEESTQLQPGQWRCGKCRGVYDYSVDFCPNDARPGPAAIMGY